MRPFLNRTVAQRGAQHLQEESNLVLENTLNKNNMIN